MHYLIPACKHNRVCTRRMTQTHLASGTTVGAAHTQHIIHTSTQLKDSIPALSRCQDNFLLMQRCHPIGIAFHAYAADDPRSTVEVAVHVYSYPCTGRNTVRSARRGGAEAAALSRCPASLRRVAAQREGSVLRIYSGNMYVYAQVCSRVRHQKVRRETRSAY